MSDDRPTSLEAILDTLYEDGYNDGGVGVRQEKDLCLDEALAAIAAYYEGLLPEKQQTSVYDSEARRLQAKGHNAAIDAMRRNFKGDDNG